MNKDLFRKYKIISRSKSQCPGQKESLSQSEKTLKIENHRLLFQTREAVQIIFRPEKEELHLKILQKALIYKKAKDRLLKLKTVGIPCDKSSSAKMSLLRLKEKSQRTSYRLFKTRLNIVLCIQINNHPSKEQNLEVIYWRWIHLNNKINNTIKLRRKIISL